MMKITNPKPQTTNNIQIPMTKLFLVIRILILCIVPIGSNLGFVYWNLDIANAGSVQFSTYYPAPFGMYDRLRLVPRANLDAQLPCDPGTMYINADAGNQLEVCSALGDAWAPLSGGPWTQSGSVPPDVYVTDITADVGIGTTTPAYNLHLYHNEVGVDLNLNLENAAANVEWLLQAKSDVDNGRFAIREGIAGVERLSILKGGNVGIGTATPIANFQINNADAVFSKSGQTPHGSIHLVGPRPYVTFSDTTAADPTDAWRIGAWDEDFVINEEDDSINDDLDLFFIQRGTGNVHIGDNFTSSPNPTAKLHIMQDAAADAFRVDDEQGDTSPFIVDATGNVGIGTATPHNTLQVAGLINFDDARFSTSIGKSAGATNTGNGNSFFGRLTGFSNTTGNYNTANGYLALYFNTTGIHNTASGYQALYANTIGNYNTASGASALGFNTTGNNNTAYGVQALYLNTDGRYNTASGYQALVGNTTGNYNIAIGYDAGGNITLGSKNIIIGADIDAPSATANNQLSIGNLIFGTGLDGTGTTVSTGNIGIGTAAPEAKLEVAGQVKITGGSPGAGKVLTSDASGLADWQTKLGCNWAGWKCRCEYDGDGSVQGKIYMGMECSSGVINDFFISQALSTGSPGPCPAGPAPVVVAGRTCAVYDRE